MQPTGATVRRRPFGLCNGFSEKWPDDVRKHVDWSVTSCSRVRVRYAETDQMGVVYHANYLVWMEVARVDYCRKAGFEYRTMEEEDRVVLAVIDARCRYMCPARFDDELEIETRVIDVHSRMVHFGYEVRRVSDSRTLARGETKHMFIDRDTFLPTRLPVRYRPLFGLLK
jgi:acyl-CoA thioester hydrolase